MDRRIAKGAALTLFLLCTGVVRAQYNQVNDVQIDKTTVGRAAVAGVHKGHCPL